MELISNTELAKWDLPRILPPDTCQLTVRRADKIEPHMPEQVPFRPIPVAQQSAVRTKSTHGRPRRTPATPYLSLSSPPCGHFPATHDLQAAPRTSHTCQSTVRRADKIEPRCPRRTSATSYLSLDSPPCGHFPAAHTRTKAKQNPLPRKRSTGSC